MRHRVAIVGGGFGGLSTARGLRSAPVDATLLDRRNHHLFQPLLYQVATGMLSPANNAAPLRALVKNQANASLLLADVVEIDVEARRVLLDRGHVSNETLVVAGGAHSSNVPRGAIAPCVAPNRPCGIPPAHADYLAFSAATKSTFAQDR